MRSLSLSLSLALLTFAGFGAATDPTASSDDVTNVTNTVFTTNDQLQDLNTRLSIALMGSDVNEIDSIVTEINKVIREANGQLQVKQIDPSRSNLSDLGPPVFTLANLLNEIAFNLVTGLGGAFSQATSDRLQPISDLMSSVNTLTGILKPFAVGGILRPVLDLVDCVLDTLKELLDLH